MISVKSPAGVTYDRSVQDIKKINSTETDSDSGDESIGLQINSDQEQRPESDDSSTIEETTPVRKSSRTVKKPARFQDNNFVFNVQNMFAG
jgi:hypothetical protein